MKDDDKVRLRPVEERDLDALGLIDTDPSVSEPFEWRGFRDRRARRRRWEEDGYLGSEDSLLVVALPDGTLAGIVV
jgi:ribosomal-protein-alanine N-acetyltransferase